ncbi:hypothetical protein ANN_18031 [Periplaneta americana]|uniref:Reverse transcriptase domain-containing protein n=1 Tax=Periplaneta americana TaxID=6978 RepID=A0ABQ8SML4_PERAM|nr:hypothetical protein ANN_18031 [Periplaneta americana]
MDHSVQTNFPPELGNADDQTIFSGSENDLQLAVCKLNEIAKKFNMTISESKSKVMAFNGKDHMRCKISINDSIIEQLCLSFTTVYWQSQVKAPFISLFATHSIRRMNPMGKLELWRSDERNGKMRTEVSFNNILACRRFYSGPKRFESEMDSPDVDKRRSQYGAAQAE